MNASKRRAASAGLAVSKLCLLSLGVEYSLNVGTENSLAGAVARRTGRDPKTLRKYIERSRDLPVYGPRQVGRPNKLAPYLDYLRERVSAFPALTATRLTRELRERG